jgi:hypothetical protein
VSTKHRQNIISLHIWGHHLWKNKTLLLSFQVGYLTVSSVKVTVRTVPHNNFLRSILIFISLLYVSALAGHLQAEYTIIFGKLPEDGKRGLKHVAAK